MYKEYPIFKSPQNENAAIWRYMDFTKFVSLLDTSNLFFTRADKLDDPFEGSYPRENVKQREISYRAGLKTLPEHLQGQVERVVSSTAKLFRLLTYITLINSWHENEHESAAMWKLYLKSKEGIAIQSTFKRLRDCFAEGTPDIHIGKVQYIDYERETIPDDNLFYPFLYKRKSFEHEHELRAVIQQWGLLSKLMKEEASVSNEVPEHGIPVSIDLNCLINKIYLAPTTPKWLFELTKSVTKKYGLDKEVEPSSLDETPLY